MSITISNDKLSASFNLKGAELFSLKDRTTETEFMWSGDPQYWGKHAPVLFPIVGTLKDNKYIIGSNEYHLPRHGFARDLEFNVKQKDQDKVVFKLVFNKQTLVVYPFKFSFEIAFSLSENILITEYRVKNDGDVAMPFSVGAHPAFALPGDFKNYNLEFGIDEKPVATKLENDLLSDKEKVIETNGKILPLDHDLFKDDALVFKNAASRSVSILHGDKPMLKISYADFPHLGVWTKPGAPFICIEPWQGYADSINTSGDIFEKEGIVVLDPGAELTKSFTVEVIK